MRLILSLTLFASVSSTQTWRLIRSDGPSPRTGAAIVHDYHRDRLLLFGGSDAIGIRNGTWEFDGARWAQRATTQTPPPLTEHAMCYDPRLRRVIVTTGLTTGGTTGWETWTYQNDNWQSFGSIPGSTPSPRAGATMVYDLSRDRIVLCGGNTSWLYFADTWELNGTTWTKITTAGRYPARAHHAMAYDASRSVVVLFGGQGENAPLNDTWEYDGQRWREATPTFFPPPMVNHTLTYDPVRARTVLYGVPVGGQFAQTWEFDGNDWFPSYASSTPTATQAAAATHDARRGSYVFGGRHGPFPGKFTNELWRYEPLTAPAWAKFGVGCAGSAGIPKQEANANGPTLGSSFDLTFQNLPAQPGIAYLALGFDYVQWNGVPLPADLGPLGLQDCEAWVAPDPQLSAVIVHGGSASSHSIRIPSAPSLAGTTFITQLWSLETTAPNGVGAVSRPAWGQVH